MGIGADDANVQEENNPTSTNTYSGIDAEIVKQWASAYLLPLCIALATFTTWVVATAGNGNTAATAQLNGVSFLAGRVTLGIALLMILATFVAQTRQSRRYIIFVGGVFLLALAWYFAIDIYELSQSMTARPDPVLGAVATSSGVGVYLTAGLSLIMIIVGWRAIGRQVVDRLPGMRQGTKLRNVLIMSFLVLLLMEGVNAALGVSTPTLEITAGDPGGDAAGSEVPPSTPTATPTMTPTGTENPYEVNDAPEFSQEDDDDVYGGVYVGGDGGSCGSDDIDGDGDGICNE
jgi:hypothetical protein